MTSKGPRDMYRFLFLLLGMVLFTPLLTYAQQVNDDKYRYYTYPTSVMLSDYIFDSGLIKLEKEDDLLEYLLLKDCSLFNLVKDDIFRQQQMMQQLNKGQAQRKDIFSKELKIYLDDITTMTRYNFTSQSLDLDRNKLYKVGSLSLLNLLNQGRCDSNIRILKFPTFFVLKLNFPISMLRIPLQGATAQQLVKTLEGDGLFTNNKVLHLRIYASIEGVQTETKQDGSTKIVVMLGQVDAIDIFADKERTKRIKRLDYAAAY